MSTGTSSHLRSAPRGCVPAGSCDHTGHLAAPSPRVAGWPPLAQVRKTPSWPRSWASFSLLSIAVCAQDRAWANLYLVRADLTPTFLAAQAAEASVAARVDQAVGGFDCANFASRAAADS